MKKTVLLFVLLTTLSKVLGFTRMLMLSFFYGASDISDVYLIAYTIPGTLFAFLGTGVTTSYIPMYSRIVEERGRILADRYTSHMINVIFFIVTVIVMVILVKTTFVVKLFASGFDERKLGLTVLFTRISVMGIYFSGCKYVFTGYLNVKENFLIPALMGVPFNLIIMLSIGLSAKGGLILLPTGLVVAMASQVIFLLPAIHKSGYRHKFFLDWKDRYLKKTLYLALPVVIGVSVNQVNVLVDRSIASRIMVGGISALDYSNMLILFAQGLFVTAIATIMYPRISDMAAKGQIASLKKTLLEVVNAMNLLVIPMTVGAMLYAKPIIKLLFGRGAFDTGAIDVTAQALFFYAIGMVGYGLRDVLSRIFYALQDTKTPMVNAAIAMVMNIGLNIFLSRYLGIGGLALATSLSALLCSGLLIKNLRMKIGSLGTRPLLISFVKMGLASGGMGVISWIFYEWIGLRVSDTVALVLSIPLATVVYFALAYAMKIDAVYSMVAQIRKKLGAWKTA